jgi:hypothetical protein
VAAVSEHTGAVDPCEVVEHPALLEGMPRFGKSVLYGRRLKAREGFPMKRHVISALGLLLFFTMPVLAQEHYTEGPVWEVTLIRVKPAQMDAYLTSLREKSKPFYEELKKQGLILDYKYFFNTTKHDPQDWDIAVSLEFKNFGAMDGIDAKEEVIRDKIFGSKQAAHEVAEKRSEIREVVSTILMREVNLK